MTAGRIAYRAEWVLPVAAAPIADGAIVVEGSKIVYVGPADGAPAAEQHAMPPRALVMPGLVNAHSHLELTVLRGLLEGLEFREWLRVLTAARRDVLDGQALLDSATIGIHEGLLAGITTYADATASGTTLAAMRACGVRGIGYLEVFGPAPSMCEAALAGLKDGVAALRQHDTALVQTGVSPHAPYTVSQPLFTAVARYARDEGLPLAVHVAESAAEMAFVREGTGRFADGLRARGIEPGATTRSPVQLLADTGVLDGDAVLVHCVHVDQDDVALMVKHGATVVHCPISNAKLGHGIAPLDDLLSAGVPTGLGSDSVASNNRMDVLGEARMAVLCQSIRQQRPDALGAWRALELATVGGARALKLDSRVGTLEMGKDADLVVFPLDRIETLTGAEPAAMLVHALAGAITPYLVLVAGVERVLNGAVVHTDPRLTDRVRAIGHRLSAWSATSAASGS